MTHSRGKVAGMLFFIAATQFLFGITIAEALYPGYSASGNYISDLGIGPSSIIFNSSAFLLGTLILVGTYFLRRIPKFKVMNTLFLVMAIGVMGVGVFTKEFRVVHGALSLIAFLFAGLSAISSFKVLKNPLSLIGLILGTMSLVSLFLFSVGMILSGSLTSNESFDSIFYCGLGPGGMERMIVYPTLMWIAVFSGHLVTQQEIETYSVAVNYPSG